MHFSAMIGFGVDGSEVRYDVTLTVLSALVAVLVVGCGLFVVGYGRPLTIKILIGGLFTGLGVGGMHYTGMAALSVRLKPGAETLSGVDPLRFMLPVIIAALIALAMRLLAVITGPTREDMEVRAQLFATPAPHPMAPSPARAAGQGSHRLR